MSDENRPQGGRIYKRNIASRCSACNKYTYYALNWGDFYPTACCSETCLLRVEADEQAALADSAEQAELEKLRARRAIMRATLLEEGYGEVESSPGSSALEVVKQLLDVIEDFNPFLTQSTEVLAEESDETRSEVA